MSIAKNADRCKQKTVSAEGSDVTKIVWGFSMEISLDMLR